MREERVRHGGKKDGGRGRRRAEAEYTNAEEGQVEEEEEEEEAQREGKRGRRSALKVLAGGLRLKKVRPRVVGTRDEQADAVGAVAGADRANLRLVRHLEGEPVDLRVHERSEGAAGEQRG